MITDFLKTKRPKLHLKIALDILKDFKECESKQEWLVIPFEAWCKLEQLEEYLEHLVHGKELEDDTKRYIKKGQDNPEVPGTKEKDG